MAYVWFKFSNLITPIRVPKETEVRRTRYSRNGRIGLSRLPHQGRSPLVLSMLRTSRGEQRRSPAARLNSSGSAWPERYPHDLGMARPCPEVRALQTRDPCEPSLATSRRAAIRARTAVSVAKHHPKRESWAHSPLIRRPTTGLAHRKSRSYTGDRLVGRRLLTIWRSSIRLKGASIVGV